jgi:outer membrane receptor for ferrienterochelin and colicin
LKASAMFFVVLLAVAQTASAQEATDQHQLTDLSLEDLLKLKVNTVYSASKFEQEIVQAPATVSIGTAERRIAPSLARTRPLRDRTVCANYGMSSSAAQGTIATAK